MSSYLYYTRQESKLECLRELIKIVKEKSLDLGIAFDGDADRIGTIDELGRIVRGDQLVAIYARDVLKKLGKQKIIFDVKCSLGLIEVIEKHNGIPFMWLNQNLRGHCTKSPNLL
jgi:phosphomannomutase